MLDQGVLPFKYEISDERTGLTSKAGMPAFFELGWALGLPAVFERQVRLCGDQGWLDSELLMGLVMLNLAGGSHVEDLDQLEADEGLRDLMLHLSGHRKGKKRKREEKRRWRKGRNRGFPSRSAMNRYLKSFHSEAEEERRKESWELAFIPKLTEGLRGLCRCNAKLVEMVQHLRPKSVATLDQDATLVYASKEEAKYYYKGAKAYQPFNTWWAEQQMVLHTEFRDGNVPAGHQQLRLLKEALACLPVGVKKVRLRSDTAGYQHEVLQYCAEGKDPRFGVIDYAICADVTPEFKTAVAMVRRGDWHRLGRTDANGTRWETKQEWAEVCFVPTEIGRKKHGPDYRYLAIREPLGDPELPGLERAQRELPFPTMQFDQRRYKVFGLVTNMSMEGEDLIAWQRERCGKSEEFHSIMKEDLAGGTMPSGSFGANAAWWWVAAISFNLLAAMKQLVLGSDWVTKRLKAIRFHIINLPGRVVLHARALLVKVAGRSGAFLITIRQRIAALSPEAVP